MNGTTLNLKLEMLSKYYYRKKGKFPFSIHNPVGVKLLTLLSLQLSHQNKQKFRYGFEDTISTMCSCNMKIGNNAHFLLRCPFYSSQR